MSLLFKARHKLLKNADILSYYLKSTWVPMPYVVYIVINSNCNLACKMCDVGLKSKSANLSKNLGGGDMDLDKVKYIVDQFVGVPTIITLNSTEPLLYPHLIEALEYIKRKGFPSRFATNGYLLEEKARDLIKARLDIITVSIDGTEEVHDAIRGVKGTYKRAIDGIKVIKREAKRQGRKIRVRVNATVSESNYDSMHKFLLGLNGLGIEALCLNHLNFITEEMMELHNADKSNPRTSIKARYKPGSIDTGVLCQELRDIRRSVREKKIDFRVVEAPALSFDQVREYYNGSNAVEGIAHKCGFPWTRVQFLQDGTVMPVMRCYPNDFGNIFEKPFREIWNGPKYKEFRKTLNERTFFPACTRCCGLFRIRG